MERFEAAGLHIIKDVHSGAKKHVILLHGYGADFTDLAPLGRWLNQGQQSPANFYFPNAPLTIEIGPHMTGQAWFALNVQALQMMMLSGQTGPFEEQVPPGLDEASQKVQKFIESLNIPSKDLVLGGFSQGSMVALDVALQMKQPPGNLLLLSSALIAKPRWEEQLKSKGKGMTIFQSHGNQDPVLGMDGAKHLSELLVKHGASHKFQAFEGGHGIPEEVLQSVKGYIY